MPLSANDLNRFNAMLDSNQHWTGTRYKDGYGLFKLNKKATRAHRAIYEHHYGPIPAGMFVCHTCDIRECCNIDHLWLGTMQQNIDDMVSKGRHKSQKKTHCKNGHEFTPANTYLQPPNNARKCRICKTNAMHRFRSTNSL